MSKPAGAIEVLEASCKYQTWEDIEPKQAKEILDYIEMLEDKIGELENQRPSPWISTAKEFPPEKKEVIIAIEHENQYEFDIAMLYDGSWITMSRIILFDSDVKYWMTPSELPKE